MWMSEKTRNRFEQGPGELTRNPGVLFKAGGSNNFVQLSMGSYPCPRITVTNMENFPIKCNIDAQIEVLPVPVLAEVILWKSLTFDQFSLGYPAGGRKKIHIQT